MNTIFHDLIGQSVEVYIDDIVVKSKNFSEHLVDLEQAFRRMRYYNLKMNPTKCAFGVASGNFLGFLVHNKGIEVDSNKTKAIINARPPENLKQFQGFLGQVNFLRIFVSNAAGKLKAFSTLLRLRKTEEFLWEPLHQQAFEAIKEAMANPPVLMPAQEGKPLRLYVSAIENTVGCLLAQKVPDRSERGIFYLSKAVANFLSDHPSSVADQAADRMEAIISQMPWILKFDRSNTQTSAGAGVFIESPWGKKWTASRALAPGFTNNQAEYEALLVGLRILHEKEAKAIRVQSDSQLILKQIVGESQCKDERMRNLRMEAVWMLQIFDDAVVEFIPRAENRLANDLAQRDSGYKPSAAGNFKSGRVCLCPVEAEDLRIELKKYLKQPAGETPEKLRKEALKYTLIDGDLFCRAADGMLMRCVDTQEAMKVIGEVHEGICGAHKSGPVMRWTIRRYGYFCPSMTEDCIKYAQGCEACQRHGSLIRIPAEEMHTVVKPYPFRGWAMDIIGKIHPPSSRRHSFILVATDYFTKWIEAVPLANVTYQEVIKFVKEHIIHRYRIPQTITADQGTTNGQAETTNEVLIGIIKKVVEDNPRRWHEVLGEALWACRQYRNKATGCTPFHMVYGQEVILPLEITVPLLRVLKQNLLSPEQYDTAMLQRLDGVHEDQMMALENIRANKVKVARAYNKKVHRRTFQEGDLVWNTVLPEEFKDNTFGKWSPMWEGLYRVSKVLPNGAYRLMSIDGIEHKNVINAKHLKGYMSPLEFR
ncbi:uncharacterized protein LOC127252493 [Andrographis paniculata]|uniref:uncharacterized protein LOC127252493 n=1 Tax=Andrographis paniculata TaxID=175694 RepID=UPI0021E8860A|nr:uncharacterized protein LOC127252493 [Andrographis paniculata]